MPGTETLDVRAVSAVAWPFWPWQLKERVGEMAQRDVPNKITSGLAAMVLWKTLEGLVG